MRIVGAWVGGVLAFAVWLAVVLIRMPRPPVPPSLAATLTAPVAVAAGFGLGMLAGERLTRRRQWGFLRACLWSWAGGTLGVLALYPLGGMMAGFGLLAFATAGLFVRELLWVLNPPRDAEHG
ncbi:MAG: hypothetical protein AB1824_03760 [Acidobacteriota bacterium]